MEHETRIESRNMLPVGTTLQGGKYTICKTLGQGSFGITYLATTRIKTQAAISGSLGRLVQDQEVEIKVCVKEFFMKEVNSRGEDGSSVEGTSNTLYTNYRKRFRKEAENLSRLEHPNIVTVLEVFDENGTTYYVMQFIEGETLDDYIKHQRQGHLEEDEAKGVIRAVAQALQYMHGKRMLHLDLKPKNIMRGTDGTEYIIDFGLSKQYDEKGEPESSTAIGLGTPGYAPTEQADNIPDGTFPATLDIYALGATLYKMLTGKTPPSANEVLNNGLPARPAHVSLSMWSVVEHAMQPRRKDRPQSMKEFLALLDTDSTEMTQTNPVVDDEETGNFKVKNVNGQSHTKVSEKNNQIKEGTIFNPFHGIHFICSIKFVRNLIKFVTNLIPKRITNIFLTREKHLFVSFVLWGIQIASVVGFIDWLNLMLETLAFNGRTDFWRIVINGRLQYGIECIFVFIFNGMVLSGRKIGFYCLAIFSLLLSYESIRAEIEIFLFWSCSTFLVLFMYWGLLKIRYKGKTAWSLMKPSKSALAEKLLLITFLLFFLILIASMF